MVGPRAYLAATKRDTLVFQARVFVRLGEFILLALLFFRDLDISPNIVTFAVIACPVIRFACWSTSNFAVFNTHVVVAFRAFHSVC